VANGGDTSKDEQDQARRRAGNKKQSRSSSGRTTASSKQQEQQRATKKQEKFHRKLRQQQDRRRIEQPSQLDFAQQLSRQLSQLEQTFLEEAKDDCTSRSSRNKRSLAQESVETQLPAAEKRSPDSTGEQHTSKCARRQKSA
jgi:hypothetical protein